MLAFMREYIPGHTEGEIRAAFSERFGIVLTESQIGNTKTRLGVRSGTHGGRFAKGQEPWNKGRRQAEWMSPEAIERTKATRFQDGNLPHNARELYEERVDTKDGFTYVHVAERPREKNGDNWVQKHHIVWEEANGRPVPKDCVIAFADGNRKNFDPENLVAVPRKLWAIINCKGIPYYDRESLLVAMDIARLRSAVFDAQTRPRTCRRCGEQFEPRFVDQKTCDRCLGR